MGLQLFYFTKQHSAPTLYTTKPSCTYQHHHAWCILHHQIAPWPWIDQAQLEVWILAATGLERTGPTPLCLTITGNSLPTPFPANSTPRVYTLVLVNKLCSGENECCWSFWEENVLNVFTSRYNVYFLNRPEVCFPNHACPSNISLFGSV